MNTSKLLTFMVLGAAGYVLLPPVPAEASKTYGRLTVSPSIKVTEEYNDNVFLQATDEESDLISHGNFDLGLVYELTDDRGELSLDYGFEQTWYNDYDENDYTIHDLTVGMAVELIRGFTFAFSNQLLDSEDPYGDQFNYGVGDANARLSDGLGLSLEKNFQDTIKVAALYNYYTQDYDDEDDVAQDLTDQEFGLGLSKRVGSSTWAFVRYFHGQREYEGWYNYMNVDEGPYSDSEWDRVNVGANWDRGSKLAGEFNLGYEWREFDNDAVKSGLPLEDTNTWIARTALTYRVTPKTATTVGIHKSIQQYSGASNITYDYIIYSAEIETRFTDKITGNAGFELTNSDYSDGVENKDYDFSLGGSYKFNRWFEGTLEYNYLDRDSTDADKEYSVNRVLLGLKASY